MTIRKPFHISHIPAAPGFKALVADSPELCRRQLNDPEWPWFLYDVIGWRVRTHLTHDCEDLVDDAEPILADFGEVHAIVYPDGRVTDWNTFYPSLEEFFRSRLEQHEAENA